MRPSLLVLLTACSTVRIEADPPTPDLGAVADAAAADVALAPSACITHTGDLDFGAVRVGESRQLTIELVGCAEETVAVVGSRGDTDPADPGFDLPLAQQELTLAASDPPARASLVVVFTPQAAGRRYNATVRLLTTDPQRPELRVELRGVGAWDGAPCGPWTAGVNEADRALGPGTVIALRAAPPPGIAREVTRVTWRVTQRPAGSVANPVEDYDDPADPAAGGSTDDPTTPESQFFIDVPGVYAFSAQTRLPEAAGCPEQSTEVRLVACPCPGDLHVQLRWREDPDDPPPVGIRSNLDLHLAHPDAIVWNDPENDCRSVNPTPDWGVAGLADDDPLLDADDADAPGVENITLERLQRSDAISGAYRVGVEHVRSEWTARADVEIRIGGQLVWAVRDRVLGPDDDWWEVAALGWFGDELTIVGLDRTFATRPPLDATLRPGAECLPDSLPPCSPDRRCAGAQPGQPGRCE